MRKRNRSNNSATVVLVKKQCMEEGYRDAARKSLITEKHCKSPLHPDVLVADGSMEIRGGFDDIF